MNWGSVQICPYYVTQTKNRVVCECINVSNDHRTSLEFRTSDEKKKWMKEHCDAWDYMKCPYAKMIVQKYKENEK